MRSHVIRLALFTLIQPQLPCPLTFPFPISTKTYYPRDLKGISKSARACKSILATRAHSSILKYLGDSSMLEHLGGSSLLESARAKVLPGSSLRAQRCLQPSMLEQGSRLGSSRLVSNTSHNLITNVWWGNPTTRGALQRMFERKMAVGQPVKAKIIMQVRIKMCKV